MYDSVGHSFTIRGSVQLWNARPSNFTTKLLVLILVQLCSCESTDEREHHLIRMTFQRGKQCLFSWKQLASRNAMLVVP